MSIRLTGIMPAIAIGLAAWAVSAPSSHAAEILAECELASVADFKKIDRDGDGVITREEYMACLVVGDASTRVEKETGAAMMEETDETFAEYDVDNDGEITEVEFEKVSGETMKK